MFINIRVFKLHNIFFFKYLPYFVLINIKLIVFTDAFIVLFILSTVVIGK